ncbi:MAG: DNA-3-methyladenine glycosylase [Deltaproteobacteria bacterium]|nr:DNA-3-methyladenine glycosylase [Deltaproteobacteria bacterium]
MDAQHIGSEFFDRDPQVVACALLGTVLSHRVNGVWLRARIIETEAYYQWDRASHASLGFTEKRRALFAPPGTIYMYYARGGDSFNVSCRGAGNAVLVKAAVPHALPGEDQVTLVERMRRRNPLPSGAVRPETRLCSGQTLLCRALGLRVPEWDGRSFEPGRLELLEAGHAPARVIRTTRLGIPPGRDGHLPFRFVDAAHGAQATRNPLRRGAEPGRDYTLLPGPGSPGDAFPGWEALLGGGEQ